MEQKKAEIMDEGAMRRAINRISYEVIERILGATDLVLAGIRSRGVYLAERMADKIAEVEGTRPQVVSLDITGFRDDHPEDPIACQLPQIDDISQKTVLIVDDVLSTGRTVRAAMEAVLHMGRAQRLGGLVHARQTGIDDRRRPAGLPHQNIPKSHKCSSL